jgi:hypothetical protein
VDLKVRDEIERNELWWGRFDLDAECNAFFKVGPFSLWASRRHHEWRLAYMRTEDQCVESVVVEAPSEQKDPPAEATLQRFGFADSPTSLVLQPALADRPVVVTPEAPFLLPPGQEIFLYVGLPLWVEVSVGDQKPNLLDLPLFIPSDTWFGSSTRSGELCYAARTTARLTLENVPVRPHRAMSEICIRNSAKSLLTVERLRVPTGQMSLYSGRDARLWTNTVTLERKTDSDDATIGLKSGPPAGAPSSHEIREPRTPTSKGFSIPAFAELLRLGG